MRTQIVIALLLALSATQAFELMTPLTPVPFTHSFEEDKCVKLLVKVYAQFNVVADDLTNSDFDNFLIDATKLANLVYADFQCFFGPDNTQLYKKFAATLFSSVVQPNECQMQHMKNAIASFKIAVSDLKLHLVHEAIEQLKVITAEVIAITECPQ